MVLKKDAYNFKEKNPSSPGAFPGKDFGTAWQRAPRAFLEMESQSWGLQTSLNSTLRIRGILSRCALL